MSHSPSLPDAMPAWQSIRLLRAHLPGSAAGDHERAAVFAAALEQSQQLMRAASEVGYAARPLPLFYSLSQAGRAVAAARLNGPAWRLAAHGLSAPEDPGIIPDLVHRVISPRPAGPKKIDQGRRDSFAGVSLAIDSGLLTGPVALGAIWRAIPDLIPPMTPQMPGLDPEWRGPLIVFDSYWNAGDHILGMRDQFGTDMLVSGLPTGANAERINQELSHYPAVAGALVRTDPHLGQIGTAAEIVTDLSPDGRDCPRISWPGRPEAHPRLDDVAPEYRGVRVLNPTLPTGDYLSPLMLWWLLLFGLSSIARYDPELWVAALDLSQSLAVPIEATLDEALIAVPGLILSALAP